MTTNPKSESPTGPYISFNWDRITISQNSCQGPIGAAPHCGPGAHWFSGLYNIQTGRSSLQDNQALPDRLGSSQSFACRARPFTSVRAKTCRAQLIQFSALMFKKPLKKKKEGLPAGKLSLHPFHLRKNTCAFEHSQGQAWPIPTRKYSQVQSMGLKNS